MEKDLKYLIFMMIVLLLLIVNLIEAYRMGKIEQIIKEDHMMIKALYNQIEAPLKVLGGP